MLDNKFRRRDKIAFNDRTSLDIIFLDRDFVPEKFDKFKDKYYLSYIRQGKTKPRDVDVYKKNDIYGEMYGGYVTRMLSGARKNSIHRSTFIEIYNEKFHCLIQGIMNNGGTKKKPLTHQKLKLFKKIISLYIYYRHYDFIDKIIRISAIKYEKNKYEIIYKDNIGQINKAIFNEDENDLTLSSTTSIIKNDNNWDWEDTNKDENKGEQSYLYVLKISNNTDTFYKFGITINPERRYSGEKITEEASKLGFYVETVLLLKGAKREIETFEKTIKKYFRSQNRLKKGGIKLLTETSGDTEMVKDAIALELESLYDSENYDFDVLEVNAKIFKRFEVDENENNLSRIIEKQLNKDYSAGFSEF